MIVIIARAALIMMMGSMVLAASRRHGQPMRGTFDARFAFATAAIEATLIWAAGGWG